MYISFKYKYIYLYLYYIRLINDRYTLNRIIPASFRPIYCKSKNDFLVRPTFTPRANCFINDLLSALTSLLVRPHSSPVNRATETSHKGQEEDKA